MMDHLSFLLSERVESLQHTARPYLVSTTRAAENFFRSVVSGTNSFYNELLIHNGSFQSRLQYHWIWLQQNISDFWIQLCTTINERFSSFDLAYRYFYLVLRNEINRSHIYIGCCCLAIGFVVGSRFRVADKPQPLMRAVVCTSYGGTNAISANDELLAPKTCGPNDLMIEVKAASLTQLDIKISLGYGRVLRKQRRLYNKVYGGAVFPLILGRECSGRVIEIGSAVDPNLVDVGDEVYAAVDYTSPGLASEVAVVPWGNVAKKPRSISHEAAATLPLSASVAWQALVLQAGLNQNTTSGKRILVHAVQTPVGCIAVQLLKYWGGHVTGTVPKRAVPLAVQLGLDDLIIIDAKGGRDIEFDREFAIREKFDVVLNTVGSSFHDSSLLACKEGGTVVTTVSSPPASDRYGFVLGTFFSLWLRFKGIFTRNIAWGDTPIDAKVLSEIAALVDTGALQPVVDRVFDVSDADRAARHVASGDTLGKTVIRFRQRPLSRLEGFG